LEVLGVNTRLGTLRPGHLRPLGSVHLDELGPGWASGKGEESRTLSDVRTSSFGPHLRFFAGFLAFFAAFAFFVFILSSSFGTRLIIAQ
jgi:hypothetical protein